MHVECPGYRDPLDQNFRDESESVVKRAQKSYKTLSGNGSTKKKACKGAHVAADLTSTRDVLYDPKQAFGQSLAYMCLAQPIEDIALSHFMASYVPGSHFDYLPLMYGRLSGNMALSATVHAASIATLARNSGRPDLMRSARCEYIQAILKTNAALADSATATEDSTLVAVLLLSLFEAVAWSGNRTPDSWTTHTRGALALIKLRGRQQLFTPVGQQLFVQVASVISVHSLQKKMPLPQELLDLIDIAMEYQAECPKYRLACLTGEVAELVANIDQGFLNADEVIHAVTRLDESYIAYADSLAFPWRYQEIIVDVSQPDVYGTTVHQYASPRAAGLWNSYRMTRILLNEIMHGYSICIPSATANAIQTRAINNIEDMTTGICASVPQCENLADLFVDIDLACLSSEYTLSPRRSTASVLWPLSVVRSADLASAEVRAYATNRLQYLGREFHIPQAEGLDGDVAALQDGLHMYYVS
jgi:hypothetical protein